MITFLDLHQGGLGNFIGQSLCASAGFHLEHYRPWCLRRSGPTFGVNTIMSREMFGSENGVPQYGYQRNRRVKSSFNDLIPRQSLGKRVLSRESHVSVWKTPSFDLSESFFCVQLWHITTFIVYKLITGIWELLWLLFLYCLLVSSFTSWPAFANLCLLFSLYPPFSWSVCKQTIFMYTT